LKEIFMKKTKLALIGLSLASSVAFASDFQLGYINVDRVFAEAKPAKAIQQALKDKYAPQQTKLQAMNTSIVKEQNDMQAIASKAPAFDKLSKEEQKKLKTLEAQYQKDQAGFQQQYMAFQQSLQKSQELALSLLMTKTNAILKELSDKKGYDLVLTSNQLVYAKAKYDVTEQVMDQLNTIDTSDIIKQINNPAPVAPMGTTAAAAAPAAPAK
jgi:outer membrane protein